jgi:hypothetical protein
MKARREKPQTGRSKANANSSTRKGAGLGWFKTEAVKTERKGEGVNEDV